MWKVSEETRRMLQTLYDWQKASIVERMVPSKVALLIEQIAERGEIVAVSTIARSLFSGSRTVRIAACRAIHRLVVNLRPEELLKLSSAVNYHWDWSISDSWTQLRPSEVESSVADPSSRSSVLGLVSFHFNGYVRHEAVRLLSGGSDGSELPFLLIRLNDWVEPIRNSALQAVQALLTDDNLSYFLRWMPLVLHLSSFRRRDHSAIVTRVMEILVKPEHDTALTKALHSSDQSIRREVAKRALELPGGHRARVVSKAIESSDGVLRYWCAKNICDCVSHSAAGELAVRLQNDRFFPVRREGFAIEAEIRREKQVEVWQRALFDKSASIRNLARFQLRNAPGFDIAKRYRDSLADGPPSVAAISGLGETGDASDLLLIRRLATSGHPEIRKAAVRGLALLGNEKCLSDLLSLIEDTSPGVVREASRALTKFADEISADLLFRLVMESSQEYTRQAALRLIFRKGKWSSLSWLIRLADHRVNSIAMTARENIETWFSNRSSYRIFTQPSPDQRKEIREAFSTKAESLPRPFVERLALWIYEI